MLGRLRRYWASLCFPGVFLGALLIAASLSPSLLPRPPVVQGILSGLALSIGYGIGALLRNLWAYFQLRRPQPTFEFVLKCLTGVFALVLIAISFWKWTSWQNNVRSLMSLPPVETSQPYSVAAIALTVFVVLLLLARVFKGVKYAIVRRTRTVAPPRLAYILGAIIALALFWSAAQGLLFRGLLRLADSSYKAMDELIDTEIAPPASYAAGGAAFPVVSWADLGRQGRAFVASGPKLQAISDFLGWPATEPIRVYVGLKAGDTPEARAKLALQDLVRRGGFERKALILITPTGTGWVDEEAVDPVEYMLGGDVASVAVQYSYLASWMSLLVEPQYGSATSRALFQEVYRFWTALPKDKRPKLYLFGLSLGALSTEESHELFEVIGDPYQGALLSGPPFPSRIWKSMTAMRDAGSPEWLPTVGDGSFVRFTAQKNALRIPGAQWGPVRTVYLQYASDPITFFDPAAIYRRPQWMDEPRGPDVSPDFRWYPVVTFLQLAVDFVISTTPPKGFGHVYAADHYIDAWREVLALDWPDPEIERLKAMFRDR